MTVNQRAGTINVGLPVARVFATPDETIDALDRKQATFCYPFAPSAVLKTASDTLSLGVTEATSDLLALLNRSDALGLSLAEQGTLLALLAVSDTVSVSIGEGYSLLVLTSVSDSLALSIAEAAASNLFVSVQVSDAVVIGVGDSASLLVTVIKAVTDTLGLSLSEVSAAQLVAYARKICRWWMNHIPFVIEK